MLTLVPDTHLFVCVCRVFKRCFVCLICVTCCHCLRTGVKAAGYASFVLVAGGLGERVGYSGIKLALPVESASNKCFLQVYCLLACDFAAILALDLCIKHICVEWSVQTVGCICRHACLNINVCMQAGLQKSLPAGVCGEHPGSAAEGM